MTEGIRLTRRRLLGGVATVGAASAAAGAGTGALLVDSEESTGNSVSAGTLDLTLDGGDQTVQFLSETGVAPGDSGQARLPVSNAGTLAGSVAVEVADCTSYENGLSGNESAVDDTGGDPGAGNGELDQYLEVHAAFANGPELWTGYDTVDARLRTGTVYDLDYVLDGGASDEFVLDWRLPDATGDDAQSDSVELALTFRLEQRTG